MELWDIYDENRNLTGKTIVRGEKLGQMNIILLYIYG